MNWMSVINLIVLLCTTVLLIVVLVHKRGQRKELQAEVENYKNKSWSWYDWAADKFWKVPSSSLALRDKLDERILPEDYPQIVTLIGSSQFVDHMAVVGWLLEKENGCIVLGLHLLPAWYFPKGVAVRDHLAEYEGVVDHMERLHEHKIDIANTVYVVNPNGYIGESTKKEIAYAKSLNKNIVYLEEDELRMSQLGSIWKAHTGE